jgi:hypothetical protein
MPIPGPLRGGFGIRREALRYGGVGSQVMVSSAGIRRGEEKNRPRMIAHPPVTLRLMALWTAASARTLSDVRATNQAGLKSSSIIDNPIVITAIAKIRRDW